MGSKEKGKWRVENKEGKVLGHVFASSNDGQCRYMPKGVFLSANASGATATLIFKHN